MVNHLANKVNVCRRSRQYSASTQVNKDDINQWEIEGNDSHNIFLDDLVVDYGEHQIYELHND